MQSRLAEFRIDGLFGLYSHKVKLNLEERITIIIGPNGRGKTVCLKCIEALFRKRLTYYSDIPFTLAEFSFTGGEIIRIRKADQSDLAESGSEGPGLRLSFQEPSEDEITWTPTIVDSRTMRDLRRFIPSSWEPISSDTWMDQTDGEELSLADLTTRYRLPSKLSAALRQQDMPDRVAALVSGIDCHLIETQRLLVLPSASIDIDHEPGWSSQARRTGRVSRLAIQEKAQKLKAIITDTLGAYANLSQSLDRSFPLRVFEAQYTTRLTQDQLREELKKLDERREALMGAGILDAEHKPVTMRSGDIDRGVAMALEIYVNDTVKKLDLFNNLRARLDLFKELIERRFIDKTLHIDRESGFKVISRTGASIPLDKLSSGEQHQLILVFDLLFEVSPNALILIDEPELSLHVAWQKTIIDSLKRIIALNAFDVLLATHSPAVVARHFALAVELGQVD
jgi:energy-coupling factor transporter ATP-binding protein EcfA2